VEAAIVSDSDLHDLRFMRIAPHEARASTHSLELRRIGWMLSHNSGKKRNSGLISIHKRERVANLMLSLSESYPPTKFFYRQNRIQSYGQLTFYKRGPRTKATASIAWRMIGSPVVKVLWPSSLRVSSCTHYPYGFNSLGSC
jgi:hypothetical protein